MIETTKITNDFDYQKKGYFNNMITGVPYADDKKLISFISPLYHSTGNITEWLLIGLDPIITVDLTSEVAKIEDGVNCYYFNAEEDVIASASCGIYYMKLTDNLGRIFRTGVFNINLTGEPPITELLGDFSPLDYNDDFFKTIT